MKRTYALRINKILSVTLCVIMAFVFIMPVVSYAKKTDVNIVRVGWYDSPFNMRDRFGRRSGYAYEYQQKIASYTGWTYEYVYGSWVELMEMLENGDIDMLSDVSLTPERKNYMLFSSLPMGSEKYYAFISDDNKVITPEKPETINGKIVGVNKGSVQEDLFKEWVAENNLETEITELSCSADEALEMLNRGDIDIYVALDVFDKDYDCLPICKIGQSDFYFALKKERTDLLKDLNSAMLQIQEDDRYFNNHLYDKYIRNTGTISFLTPDEKRRVRSTIRVGYLDDYMPFCGMDKKSGELTGTLSNFLELASSVYKNSNIRFDAIPYSTAEEALKALENEEIDCVFPVNLSVYDGEVLDVLTTNKVMQTEMYALFDKKYEKGLPADSHSSVALLEGNTNYDVFLKDYFPKWDTVFYKDINECFKSVSQEEVDCVLISSYRLIELMPLIEKYNLKSFTTSETMNLSFAVKDDDKNLYSVLNDAINLIPEPLIESALTVYSNKERKASLASIIKDNWGYLLGLITLIFAVILGLLLQSLKSAKEANESQKLISVTETDSLTKLYNKNFFIEYANRMYQENPDKKMDAIITDIDRFHFVNEIKGRDFGDQVLKILSDEILSFLEKNEGIAGRFDGDCFAVYTESLDDYEPLLLRLRNKLKALSEEAALRLCMGVMPWQEGVKPNKLFESAKVACSMAHSNFNRGLVVFSEEVIKSESYDQRLLNDIQHAIENHELEVYYQPKYDLRCNPPQLASVEALVRWIHPELGKISPKVFIPLFERNGQISKVDKYVWEESAYQIAKWKEKYNISVPVSANVSRIDVLDPTFEQTLDEILEKNNLSRDMFMLEITESACAENGDRFLDVIEELHNKGYVIEMDDFGTGYSSLNMISKMPIDILKMDKDFITDIENSEEDIRLVELILNIAKSIDVPVVAEGVETKSQLELLKELGCTYAQGYYFSKPMLPSDFEREILKV